MPDIRANNFRGIHTRIRVGDRERSVAFYSGHFGMRVLKKVDVPDAKYTNVFVGYGDECSDPMIELTYNCGVPTYEVGNGFGHLAIGVHDIYGICETLRAAGVKIAREPGPLKFGTVHIAFIEDPDGYRIELIDLDTGDYAQGNT